MNNTKCCNKCVKVHDGQEIGREYPDCRCHQKSLSTISGIKNWREQGWCCRGEYCDGDCDKITIARIDAIIADQISTLIEKGEELKYEILEDTPLDIWAEQCAHNAAITAYQNILKRRN